MKKLYFLLLVMSGIFLMPASSLACSKKIHKKDAAKEITSHKHKNDSCEKETSKDNCDHDCKGKCGHSSCICPVSSASVAVFFNQEFSNPLISPVAKKLKFYYAATDFASGFYSIWLRPKIS